MDFFFLPFLLIEESYTGLLTLRKYLNIRRITMFYATIIEDNTPIEVSVFGNTLEEAQENALASFTNVIDVKEV